MSDPEWGEYARIQALVSADRAPDEHLDRFLQRYAEGVTPFDLHDARRWGLNLSRNLARRRTARLELLRRNTGRLTERPTDNPFDAAAKAELRASVRRIAGDDWVLLRATACGDYAAVAAATGRSVGTLKSQVCRARQRLKPALAALGSNV